MSAGAVGLPLWFRATVALAFGALFAAHFAAREQTRAHAGAARAERAPPARATLADSSDDGAEGDYRVNGVRIRSRRLWIAGAGSSVLDRLASDAAAAGYRTERTSIAGRHALLGLHPESGVLLTATIDAERDGRTLVRLADQRLREATDARRLVPGDVALLPDARDVVVVAPLDGALPLTAIYAVARSPDRTRELVDARMTALGWAPIHAGDAARAGEAPQWLGKGGREASVVVRPNDRAGSLVVIAVDEPHRGATR